MVVRRAVGREYPRSYARMRAWFDGDWKCRDYPDWPRWPEGFVRPHRAGVVGWGLADSRWECGGCDRKVSATAGTIFDKTRTPLTVWFATAWRMVEGQGRRLSNAKCSEKWGWAPTRQRGQCCTATGQ